MSLLRSIPAPAEALLGSSALAHVVTRNRDGTPQVSVVGQDLNPRPSGYEVPSGMLAGAVGCRYSCNSRGFGLGLCWLIRLVTAADDGFVRTVVRRRGLPLARRCW